MHGLAGGCTHRGVSLALLHEFVVDALKVTVVVHVDAVPPPLAQHPARRVSLLVEPTPFTHVSGYSNRFKEMLRFLKEGGDPAF